jgi:hypothetical protein
MRGATTRIVASMPSVPSATANVRADRRPTSAMFAPVQALAAFMASLPLDERPEMFAADGVTIIENFPPYIFGGRNAVARWEEGFRKHAAATVLTDLNAEFGPARDFSVAGSRAFFALPTTWMGRVGGVPFEERGAWSFALVRMAAGWRIRGFGWGVTSVEQRSR